MIGSIYAIIMGPTTLSAPKTSLNFANFSIITFIIGGFIVLGLELLSIKFKDKD